MGTIPMAEDVRVACPDGIVVLVSSDTTTSDLGMGDEGTAGIYGRIGSEEAFSFAMPLQMYSERWFERFCDAIAARPEFRTSLSGVEEIGGDFVIPGAPNRDGGAIGKLARKGGNARFRDFADLRSGRDRFSAMKLPQLEAAVGDETAAAARKRMASVPDEERDNEVAKALRWVLRGLPVAMAARKTEVDREITANAKQSGKRRR